MDFIKKTLDELKKSNLLRKIKTIDKIKYPYIYINKKKYLLFSSNDYLGLMNNRKLKNAAKKAIQKYGTGTGASRLISGTYKLHKELENEVAKFKRTQSALVFPSGYQTNISVISSLVGKEDLVILDKLNHASLIDGARLSGAQVRIYPHKNIQYLEKILKSSKKYKNILVITDSVFSMDGDLAPLKEITKLTKKYKAMLMVDEAHATGVYGENGGGLIEEYGLYRDVDIQMGTFSKALGGQGGYIAGSKKLIEYLINKARGFIYSTGLSPAIAGANLEAIKMKKERKILQEKLWKNIKCFTTQAEACDYVEGGITSRVAWSGYIKSSRRLQPARSQSHIVPIMIGDEKKTLQAAKYLFDHGIYAPPIRYPTVAKNQGRIRISLSAFQRKKDIDKLVLVLEGFPHNLCD